MRAAKLGKPRSEGEVLKAILAYLSTRGDVVAWRANSRVVRMPGSGGRSRLVRFGFVGQPDIVGYVVRKGQLTSAMWGLHPLPIFLAIEVKAEGKLSGATVEQAAFLERVKRDGGIAVVADDVATVAQALG